MNGTIKIISTLFLLGLLSGCIGKMDIVKKTVRIVRTEAPPKPEKTPHIINVLVHGTRFLPAWLLEKFFYCKEGMHHISKIHPKLVQYRIADQLSATDPYNFPLDSFYAFVWSGKLCFQERKKSANDLYEGIRMCMREYRKAHHRNPKLRLITMSHGGNVALNMGGIEHADSKFHIHELILLCCPVQYETQKYISHTLFKKIYSLYSTADYIQKLDPQGLYTENNHKDSSLFSRRLFEPHPKLKQAKIKINGFTIGHLHFCSRRFMALLPHILKELHDWVMDKHEGREYILSMHQR